MKKLLALLLLGTALVAPSAASAAQVTLSGQMTGYGGPPAYIAVYLTGPDGSYDSTLYVAGHKTRYYRELGGWVRYAAADPTLNLDGITGASIGSGQSFSINLDLADALIDAGYTLHIDSAVEDGGSATDDVVIPLDSASSGVSQPGRGFIRSASVNM
ncbi:DUF2271 domain-containing protein [Devosia sp. PTR5]|uniref:DUF2271 domain-containing protein n=1 Tax=Devosia oryzisoli TaxID=2774138 RepID=A0A927FYS4_9HYPH|nr:DUF2271 domain-containing protein [Devosia oryzisoli]MBD8066576.1 DUF2271 domain-containing protein [Devosia oryzisoli]